MENISQEHLNKITQSFLTDVGSEEQRYSFDPETKSWMPHEEISNKIPRLVNPDYVDCEPNELWIDFTTGEVKETTIRKNI